VTDPLEPLLQERWPSLTRRLAGVEADTLGATELGERWLPSAQGLALGAPIGEGGMGVVRSARQHSLGRDVAVKEARGPEHVAALEREAWVTGQLQHPAIVPVHDLVFDGGPKLVMKRLGGRPWGAWVGSALPERFGPEPLEAHVRVLARVCEALHFAHTRGVLHLDLKPDNVMLGEHGEVTLLDWGLALALEPGTPLPPRESRTEIVGSLAYMAPEMLAAEGRLLSPRTDVYLVGATLFELLAGHPPHQGQSVLELAHRIVNEDPALPPDASPALAAVCRRALAREPAARYATVEAVRRALEDALRHRASDRAATEAGGALRELADARAAGDAAAVLEAGAAARFGFQLALQQWPDNPAALRGLSDAGVLLAHAALDRGELEAAEAQAARIDAPPDLVARLEAVREDTSARRREDARLRRDADPELGLRGRSAFFVALLALFAASPLPPQVFPELVSWLSYGIGSGLFATLAALLLVLLRGPLTRTRANRQAAAAMAINLFAQAAALGAAYALGLPLERAPVVLFGVWSTSVAFYAGLAEPRLWPGVLIYGGCGLAAAAWPAYAFASMSVANAGFAALLLAVWRPAD
jgi:predicted Ser/Thr protein kinase